MLTVANVPLRSRFVDSLNEMRRAQWLNRESLLLRSEARLRLLLKHAAENVPYYRALATADLQQLPILTKSDYRERAPETFYATNISPGFRIDRKTSGSTGEPFEFSLDRRALPVIFASHLFYDSWHGLEPFDRYIRIIAPPGTQAPLPSDTPTLLRLQKAMTTGLQSFYESWTQQKISLWQVNAEGAESVWRRIEAFRPKFVMGYTSSLAAISDELLRRNLRLSRPIHGVIAIAETLTPDRKRLIEEYFAAPIINRYGLREFGSWSAQSCPQSPDRFHVNTELVVCEVLRPDGTPCEAGETGRVVLTDLHNFVRPFIRYDTGDLATAVSENCSCGRGFPLLGPIEGRSVDCLTTPSGAQLSPAVLGHFLFVYCDHLKAVRHYQLVQESATQVRLLIVPGAGWDEAARVRLRDDLVKLLRNEMEVEVQTVSEIAPEKSGKRPIIKRAERRQ